VKFLVKKYEIRQLRMHLSDKGTINGQGGLGVFFFNEVKPRARSEYQEVELKVTKRKLTRRDALRGDPQ